MYIVKSSYCALDGLDSLDFGVDVCFIVSKLYWYTIALHCHGDDVCERVNHPEVR